MKAHQAGLAFGALGPFHWPLVGYCHLNLNCHLSPVRQCSSGAAGRWWRPRLRCWSAARTQSPHSPSWGTWSWSPPWPGWTPGVGPAGWVCCCWADPVRCRPRPHFRCFWSLHCYCCVWIDWSSSGPGCLTCRQPTDRKALLLCHHHHKNYGPFSLTCFSYTKLSRPVLLVTLQHPAWLTVL